MPPGTTHTRWQITREPDAVTNEPVNYHAITVMPVYRNKSFEELRAEGTQIVSPLRLVSGGASDGMQGVAVVAASHTHHLLL